MMLFKFEYNFRSLGLLLMSYHLMVSAAIVKQVIHTHNHQQNHVLVPHKEASRRNNYMIPILSSRLEDNPNVPHYPQLPNYPHVQFHQEREPSLRDVPISWSQRQKKVKNSQPMLNEQYRTLKNDQEHIFNEEQDHRNYYHPMREHNIPQVKPKKMYKAVEMVYYYPKSGSDIDKNINIMDQMKDTIPGSYEPFYNTEDINDSNNQRQRQQFIVQKEWPQMAANPSHQDSDQSSDDGLRADQPEMQEVDKKQEDSQAMDDIDFNRDEPKEAKKFDEFLKKLRNSQFSRNTNNGNTEDNGRNGGKGANHRQENSKDTMASDDGQSVAENNGADNTGNYEKANNYFSPEDLGSKEKSSHQNQMRRGQRYNTDAHIEPLFDEEPEGQNQPLSGGLQWTEQDESEYLSNLDVVKQLRNSEKRYNSGFDPNYSSQKDFDEVKGLEKMIEKVSLLNKKKEMSASDDHDQHRELSENNGKNKSNKMKNRVKV